LLTYQEEYATLFTLDSGNLMMTDYMFAQRLQNTQRHLLGSRDCGVAGANLKGRMN